MGHDFFNDKLMIKKFSIREGRWYIGIKGDGDVKSKGARLLILEWNNEITLHQQMLPWNLHHHHPTNH